ncbi:hypothetical protein ACMA1D_01925 [Streptomyces sp. 796.1]|uniref:hypothetical protein n=1 Tax=Streptomyces sp. 796.1 TaxID=3163029 RepID=UPI0039C95B02
MDERLEVAVVGGPLRKYKVRSAGGAETTLKLNASDADARGLTDADLVEARRTEAVSLPADNDGAGEADGAKAADAAPNKARSAANKGRAPRGKGGAGGGG